MTGEPSQEILRAVASLFPDRTSRWSNDQCKAGRIPGAVKIGNTWFIRESDMAALVEKNGAPDAPKIPTVDEALADLRGRGLLPRAA